MTQPPGWYPDPSDPSRNRFWDGTTWDIFGPPLDYPPDPPPAPPPRRPSAFVVAGLLLAGVAAVAGIGLLASRISDDASGSSRTTTPSATTTPTTKTAPSAAQLDRASYREISQRDFLILLKDPGSHYGERIVIYGKVQQFDSVTGAGTFRSAVMGQPHNPPGENAIITAANPSILGNVVEGDSLTMFVEVAGTETYQSQTGGSVTAPVFTAYIVEPFKPK